MTNIFNHHLQRSVFHTSAHPAFDQQASTSSLTEAGRRTDNPDSASPRSLPRAAASGTPRDPTRQMAFPKPQPPQALSTQESLPAKGNIELLHIERGAAPQESQTPIGSEPRPKTERPLSGVRQDKARFPSARTRLSQPARNTGVFRAPLTNNGVVRSQSVAGAKQNLVQVTLWVDPHVKEHLERRAKQEGLSLSPAGAAFLHKAVQQDIDLQYSALLRPIIEDAIAKQMRGIATRLAWLLVRVAFDSGQTRSLVTNILGRQPGVTQGLLKTILEASARSSKANITRRTPQIASLIEAVENWITTEDGGKGTAK